MSERRVIDRYADPLDVVWRQAAERVGLRVIRSEEVFAATDGRGTLTVGAPSTLDADDCLAQMIFHELCHSLVQGPESFDAPDWGLDNETARDLEAEHACLRAQAVLARRHGLGVLLAPTTEHRVFYDALGVDPLAGDEPSVRRARLAVRRASRAPWGPYLSRALEATSRIARAAAPFAAPPSLFARVEEPPPPHPSGAPLHPAAPGTCGDCAWRGEEGCRSVEAEVEDAWPACASFEASVSCDPCGACCREAYSVVEVSEDDAFVTRHPDLLERIDGRLTLRRLDGRCPPLEGDGSEGAPFRCAVYADRPQTCRDFTLGSDNCLDARRRLGLSL